MPAVTRAPEPTRVPAPANQRTEPKHPSTGAPENLKDALLAEIRAKKGLFYNTVVAQAQRIDVAADKVTFSFLPTHRALREQLEATRAWLEDAASKIAGRKIAVVAVQGEAAAGAAPAAGANPESAIPNPGTEPEKKRDLKAEAMSSSTVQAMLDVFPAEIREVEETQ